MDVQGQVRIWLLQQQDWIQEAADKLLKKGSVTPEDISQITALLKTQQGQAVSKHRSFDELTHAAAGSVLRLRSLSDVTGIESLGPRAPLEFGTGNLTVIYGQNGSGKSCYTRILKKATGKTRATDLKPNVFQPAPTSSKCTINFELDQTADSVEWHIHHSPLEKLREIDIFDSDEAQHYLKSESAATYSPPIMGLFEKLATVTDKVKELLQGEQDSLVSALPIIPPAYQETSVGKSYRALSTLKASAVEQMLHWTPEDMASLDALNERLKATDAASIAKQKRETKNQVVQMSIAAKSALTAYGPQQIDIIRALRADAVAKRRIATEGAQAKSAILDGVGTPTWRALWEAARQYSLIPYAQVPFPVTQDGKCVLCHQDLSEEAQARLNNFEQFVQGRLETDARTAEAVYAEALLSLSASLTESQVQTQCTAASLTPEWKTALWNLWSSVTQIRTALLGNETGEIAGALPDFTANLSILDKYAEQLGNEADQFDQDALQFDRLKANAEKTALETKQWVSQQSDAIRNEQLRLKSSKQLDSLKTLASSRRISTKATEISENVVTEVYVARFNKELRLLGATRIQVELVKTRTSRAKVLHQLKLKAVKNTDHSPDKVLSEGERRIISLAAFLADVTDKPGVAPFIFDDPISSLDHDFEWQVACRLAELAKDRQVLIFTHRLSLYGAMEDVAKKIGDGWKKANYRAMCIESYGGASGHPADQAVWNSPTKTANNILLDRLRDAKKAGDTAGAVAYYALAQGICSDFRKLIERSVEDDLLQKIVVRHRRGISTDGRLPALLGITHEELHRIDELMTKFSCFEHSQSDETPVQPPEEAELRVDIESLKKWRDELEARRKLTA
ncbi:restriction endonuclease [Pseudomonas syringae]|uniref:Restriction endonuclease n=1 Tax=Pseudomonas syringae TaxID=317 RepID=A0A1C7Z1I3_PSESX|nr:AAA family ATPase [Pseudomonas syringae]OCR22358.1 restriction endonuclease [Pseudomonas syringae]